MRDGNCLFRAFSDQVYGTPEHYALVRDWCTKYISVERDYFEQFVAEPFGEFLARIQREGEWGDDVEVEALSEIYGCRVEIYDPYTREVMRTFHESCDADRPHPVRLQYEGHAHYNSLVPRTGLVLIVQQRAPGEIEKRALERSRTRREAGQGRGGDGAAERAEREVRLSRLEFEHKSQTEMDKVIENSRIEWEKAERLRMDKEVVDAMLQQSELEEEQKQLAMALNESEQMGMYNKQDFPIYSMCVAKGVPETNTQQGSSPARDCREYLYPESVYVVMSMGFPLEECMKAYHLVGDNSDNILEYCCQNLGR